MLLFSTVGLFAGNILYSWERFKFASGTGKFSCLYYSQFTEQFDPSYDSATSVKLQGKSKKKKIK